MVIGSIKRLSKVARDFNVGISTIVEFLHKKGFAIDTNPNNKITDDAYLLLEKEYKGDVSLKKESEKINLKIHRGAKESVSLDDMKETGHRTVDEDDFVDDEVIIKGNTSKKIEPSHHTEPKPAKHEHKVAETYTISRPEIEPLKVLGTINLDHLKTPHKKKEEPVIQVEKPAVTHQKPVTEPKPVAETAVKEEEKAKVEKTVAEVIEEKPTVAPKHEVKEKKHHEVAKPEIKEEKAQVIFQVDHSDNEVMTTNVPKVEEVKVVGRIDLNLLNQKTRPAKKSKRQKEEERKDRDRVRRDTQQPAEKENIVQKETGNTERTSPTVIKAKAERLSGPTVVGRIELPSDKKPVLSEAAQQQARNKKKRKRISKDIPGTQQRVNTVDKPLVAGERRKLVVTKNIGGTAPAGGGGGDRSKLKKRPLLKKEVSEEDVQKQI
ncbi:MAG: hypothetical protein Q8T04_13640, partial [Bacteroidota bacterium]|nr:hypothetical protein [Bacteroidota bacterium]